MKKILAQKRILWLFVLAGLFFLAYPLVRAQVSPEKADAKMVKYTSENLPDPFKSPFEIDLAPYTPGQPEATTLTHLQVQGMVWNSKSPQAIINNTVVRVGEVIEDAEILDIRKEGIYLQYQNKQYILRPMIPGR